jgi:hypothetical protein
VPLRSVHNGGPVFKYTWRSSTSVHASGLLVEARAQGRSHAAPNEADHSGTKPCLRAKKTTSLAKPIGKKVIEVNGQSLEVGVYSAGVGNVKLARRRPSASAYCWQPFIEAAASKSEETKSILAHIPTAEDIEDALDPTPEQLALDGGEEARQYMQEYELLEIEKYKIVPAINDPCEGRAILQSFTAAPTNSVGTDVWIDTDGTVRKRGSNQQCGQTTTAPCLIEQSQCHESNPLNGSVKSAHCEIHTRFVEQLDKERAPNLFVPSALHNVSSKEMKLDQRQQVSDVLKSIDCPRSTVARLSHVHLSDLSGWLNNRSDISQDKIDRIVEVTADIATLVQGIKQMSTWRVPIDLSDVEGMKQLIIDMHDARDQLPLFPAEPEEDKVTANNGKED